MGSGGGSPKESNAERTARITKEGEIGSGARQLADLAKLRAQLRAQSSLFGGSATGANVTLGVAT